MPNCSMRQEIHLSDLPFDPKKQAHFRRVKTNYIGLEALEVYFFERKPIFEDRPVQYDWVVFAFDGERRTMIAEGRTILKLLALHHIEMTLCAYESAEWDWED
jgi:hypothetical protein